MSDNAENKDFKDILNALKLTVSDTSFKQYNMMYGKLGIKSIDDLKDVDEILKKIEGKSLNTQKNYFASIVKLLRFSDDSDKLIELYSEHMKKMIDATKGTEEYNDKQKKNLMTKDEIEQIRKGLIRGMSNFKTKLNYDILLDYVILSLYTLQPPRRNEYFNMRLVDKMEKIKDDDNYLIWGPNKKAFVFQSYKTAWKYGRQIIPVSKEMEAVLKKYIPIRNFIAMKDNDHLLVKWGNLNMENSNDITRRLNRALGKSVGASMLRHIYLSEKYGETLKEMKEDAMALGHSLDEQKEYIKQ